MSQTIATTIPTILVFDSGIGGLTVHAELVRHLPIAHFVYVADDAAFPYGNHSADILINRVKLVIGEAISRFAPDLVVIACNTASTICLPSLRAAFAVPFVGTVPAIKPAAALSQSKMISVLGTPGTVCREYTHDLIIDHAADCQITLVGSQNLAGLSERFLAGKKVTDAAVLAEILPCFKEKDGRRTDAIALACTHYPLLQHVYDRVAPWPVTWVDPAPAIAARVGSLLSKATGALEPLLKPANGIIQFSTGKRPVEALEKSLLRRGLKPKSGFLLPFDPLRG